MEVSGQLHSPAALAPGKELLGPTGKNLLVFLENIYADRWKDKFRAKSD
jgi:hypothetical protein